MKIFDPKQYGAVGDGRTLDTKAIQAAIDDAAGSGGIVVLEEGRYLTSSLFLGSNMEFHMKKGAVLLGTTEEKEYPIYGYPRCGNRDEMARRNFKY
ncbi:MAG: glycosyl hydrolase family 28-related protein [Enterocloster sp.]